MLKSSDLAFLWDLSRKPREAGDLPADAASTLIGRSLVRRTLGSYAITAKGQLALARQRFAAPKSTLAARTSPDIRGENQRVSCLIRAKTTLTGNIQARGNVRIEGEVRGDIRCASLVINERARISGDVVAETVIVGGRVVGTIRCGQLLLRSTCRVEGEIYHGALHLAPGAYFEGKSRRLEDPIRTAAAAPHCEAAIRGSRVSSLRPAA